MSEVDTFNPRELVPRAISGDTKALSALLAHYGPRVQQGLQIGRQWQGVLESGDVMQITYLEAFLQISRFRPDQAENFSGWLGRIAENNLRDAIRELERQKRPPPSRQIQGHDTENSAVGLYEMLATTSSTPSRAMARKDVHRVIEAALERLPREYADVVRLYDLQNKDIAQVAAAMNRSTGAVHMMRARAHERLGELLQTASSWFAE